MLLTPFFAAAILVKRLYWPELAALVAIACAFALKDPLVTIARQRFVWKQEHPETRRAIRSALVELVLLAICGIAVAVTRDWRPFVPLCLGAAAFTVLAVVLNVRNRQRSEWFQVSSAVALSSTAVAACLSAGGTVPSWGWTLWLLCALQAAAGIFVVHARLDARIAVRKGGVAANRNRRVAFIGQLVLLLAGISFAVAGRPWIAAALFTAVAGSLWELRRQQSPKALETPLKRVGLEALGLSIVYALLIVVALWNS